MINKFENIFFIVLDDKYEIELISDKFNLYYVLNEALKVVIDSNSEAIILLDNIKLNKKDKFLLTKTEKNNRLYICLNNIDEVLINGICSLTNLPNRISLINYLSDYNIKDKIFVCLINLDDFSSINDVYGGLIGDEILKNISIFLQKTLYKYKIFKLRDDEFAIVSTDSLVSEHISFLEKIISSYFNKPFYIEEGKIRIGSTAVFALDYPNLVLKNANETLKYAKANKKNFLTYSEDIIEPKSKKEYKLNTINKIKHCISNKLIIPYYQPIINNKTGLVEKYEALMRLHYNNEILFPNDFMTLSLKSKTYSSLTQLILDKIFEDVNLHNISVSINLTMDDINNNETCYKIFELLNNCKFPENITFEIIETIEIINLEIFRNFISNIKKYNAKISIDDFGSGYANFEYFSRFEFDYLKIDGYFIKDILTNIKHQNIVNSLVLLTKKSNIKLIAEFVENEEIYKMLQRLGIHFSQGYFFGKAQPIQNIINKKESSIAC